MKRHVAVAAEQTEELSALLEGVERHLKAHMRHDAAAYQILKSLVSDLASAIRSAEDAPRERIAALVDKVAAYLGDHINHDKANHGHLLADVAHTKAVLEDLIGKYYSLLDEYDTDKEKREGEAK